VRDARAPFFTGPVDWMIIPRSRIADARQCVWLTLDVYATDARDKSLPIPANDRTLHDINKDRALGITRVAMLVNRRLGAMIMIWDHTPEQGEPLLHIPVLRRLQGDRPDVHQRPWIRIRDRTGCTRAR
jgi:hypothetical protein